MKLISCHIENYGQFKNRDFDFEAGITPFCEPNGYGKTTLASFLEAMFYGLETDRATSDFNERRHFYPFDGGNFGGHVTFSVNGEIYKVERYFDEKSSAKDSLTLYRNGILALPPEGTLGEEVFGIDKASFERTVFITASEIEITPTGSINAKLGRFLEGGTDDNNLETARKKLEEKSKLYKPSKSANSLLSQEVERSKALEAEIENLKEIGRRLPEKKRLLAEAEGRIAELSERVTKAQTSNVVLKDWEQYDTLLADIEARRAEIGSIEGRYPRGIPSEAELERAKDAVACEDRLNAQMKQRLFSDEDNAAYLALQAKFERGFPEEERLTDVERQIDSLSALDARIERLGTREGSTRENDLKQRFRYRTPSKDELAGLDAWSEDYRRVERAYLETPDHSGEAVYQVAPTGKSNKLYPILLALAALLLVGGLAAVFFVKIVGIVLLALGGVLLLADAFLYLNGKSGANHNGQPQFVQAENPEKRRMGEKKDALLYQIQAYLATFGYTVENGVPYAVKSIKDDVRDYHACVEREAALVQELARAREERQTLEEGLRRFFAQYQAVGENFRAQLTALRMDMDKFRSLAERRGRALVNEKELGERLTESRKTLADFCVKYGFRMEYVAVDLRRLEGDVRDLAAAKRAVQELETRAAQLKAEKNLVMRPAGDVVDIGDLNTRLHAAQSERTRLVTDLTQDEYEVERLGDAESELAECEERVREYKAKYKLLTKTLEALEAADRKLKDRYIKPIKDKFVYYSTLLEKTLGEKVTMDANFEIRFERSGKERSEKHLSSGQRSICALCFRLALIDNMYSGEKPFLILDDPFVNMDEEHLEKVKTMLVELSKNLQIVYFACHSSRAL